MQDLMVVPADKSLLSLLGTFPQPLDRQQEIEIFEEYQQTQNTELYKEIVYRNLRFVVYIVRQFKTPLPQMDLFQEGTVGLMKCVDKFELSREVRFISFAVRYIKSAINEYIIKNLSTVKCLTSKPMRKLLFNKTILDEHDDETVAKKLNVKVADVKDFKIREVGFFPANLTIHDKYEKDLEYSLIDDLNYDLVDDIIATDEAIMQQKHLVNGLQNLNERDHDIVVSSYLNGETLHTLSARWGVSPERIRQLKVKAIEKIQIGLI